MLSDNLFLYITLLLFVERIDNSLNLCFYHMLNMEMQTRCFARGAEIFLPGRCAWVLLAGG